MPIIVNLTPHAIVLRARDGTDTEVAPSGMVARVSNSPGRLRVASTLNAIVEDWSRDMPGGITDLPDMEPGKVFIVSGMVGDAIRSLRMSRPDVRVPGTGPQDGAIRNDKGHLVAVTRLKQVC